jgi:putative membrane protein
LAGLFGLSNIFSSLIDKTNSASQIPKQNVSKGSRLSKSAIAFSGIGSLGGFLVGILPGVGAGNIAAIFAMGNGKKGNPEDSKQYLMLTSALNTSEAVFSIVALLLIEKSRSGASVAIGQLLHNEKSSITEHTLLSIFITMLIASVLSFIILQTGKKRIISFFSGLDSNAMNISVALLLLVLIGATTGFWGIIIALTGASLGMLSPLVHVQKSLLMGYFMVPVMLFYSGFQRHFVTATYTQTKIHIEPHLPASSLLLIFVGTLALSITTYISLKKIR